MNKYAIKDLSVGMCRDRKVTITRKTIEKFAEISGDYNPIHLNESYAEATIFGGCIAHGGILNAVISNIIGNELPGPGSILLEEEIKYKKPVMINDTIKFSVSINKIVSEKNLVLLDTKVVKFENIVVAEGSALVMLLEDEDET